jgi:hypothetical protein
VADHPAPYTEDELLHSQMEARERASREDAAIQGHRRSQAAARALGVPPPPPAVGTTFDTSVDDDRIDDGPVEPDTRSEAEAEPELEPEPLDRPGPAVVLPRGGPAAVTTGVLAAAAAQKPRAEKPLLELRPTALATEIDRIGDQLVVMTDRIELRDRHGGLRRQLALADIEDVAVERRLTSAVLHLKSRTANDMVVKGLRPDLAEEAQAAVLALLPEVPLISSIEEKALMHSILALHRAGVLNDAEVATKTTLVARMAGH